MGGAEVVVDAGVFGSEAGPDRARPPVLVHEDRHGGPDGPRAALGRDGGHRGHEGPGPLGRRGGAHLAAHAGGGRALLR